MLDVHGSFEELEEQKSKRMDIREAKSERQFEKKIKEMRQQVCFFELCVIFLDLFIMITVLD